MSEETKSEKLEKLIDRMEQQKSDAALGGDGDGDGGQDSASLLGTAVTVET